MEHFEGHATEPVIRANPVRSGTEILEKGAFERGLPDCEYSISNSADHHVQNHINCAQSGSSADRPDKLAPVILLIDDEDSYRNVLRQVLVNAGYEVIEAANGAEGIRRFFNKPADMIITDIIMPEKEGIETIIELKRAFPKVKLIAMCLHLPP